MNKIFIAMFVSTALVVGYFIFFGGSDVTQNEINEAVEESIFDEQNRLYDESKMNPNSKM